jgi:hypothetical protein
VHGWVIQKPKSLTWNCKPTIIIINKNINYNWKYEHLWLYSKLNITTIEIYSRVIEFWIEEVRKKCNYYCRILVQIEKSIYIYIYCSTQNLKF